jgi:hypothetical protein
MSFPDSSAVSDASPACFLPPWPAFNIVLVPCFLETLILCLHISTLPWFPWQWPALLGYHCLCLASPLTALLCHCPCQYLSPSPSLLKSHIRECHSSV